MDCLLIPIYYCTKKLKTIRFFWPAVAWFILSFVLLTLPGSSLPSNDWLTGVGFDKYVHIGMFGMLVLLFCGGFWKRKKSVGTAENTSGGRNHKDIRGFIWIAVFALTYGIIMEFVQRDFIPLRSFDLGDILADGVGSFLGAGVSWFAWLRRSIKK